MSHFDDDTGYWDDAAAAANDRAGTARRGRRPVERTRTHHVVASRPFDDADDWSPVDHWVEPEPRAPLRLRAVDPRLVRLGAVVVAVVLAVPIALAMRSDPKQELRAGPVGADTVAPTTTLAITAPGPAITPAPATSAPRSTDGAPAVEAASGGSGSSAIRAATPARARPACAGTYTVIFNDYWNRFPKTSGASVTEWLTANNATADTPLYVGDKLCIPAGAKAPAPPVTAPPTTAAPVTTTAITKKAPPTAKAPSTTVRRTPRPAAKTPATTAAPSVTKPAAAPTTAAAAPPARPVTPAPAAADPASVEAMIRQIWPDDIEERALTIARRESHLIPTVHNWCCYGVFAIYFEMGRNFLPQMGITRPQQLLDARTNILAAYKLYTLAGWGPWAQTDPGS